MVYRQCGPVDDVSTLSPQQTPFHIRRICVCADHEYEDAFALRSYHETILGTHCADRLCEKEINERF